MSCSTCGKKGLIHQARMVVNGFTYYIEDKNFELFQERSQECRKCNSLTGHGLFCGQCKCLLQAKLRVEEERCPIGKWEATTKVA